MEYFFQYIFSGLATIITGTVAIIIYFIQKRNNKIQAARMLLTEIRTAEEQIEIIKEKITSGRIITDLPNSIFPTNNWKKYAHLFVSDFDQDDLKLMNSFYDYGEQIEDFSVRNNNYFWITTEERARVTVQMIAKFVDESFTESDKEYYIKNKKQLFTDGMDNHNTPYSPIKTLDGIKNLISRIQTITTSSTGTKLKKLANLIK